MDESLSIEETNKIRVKLGLAPVSEEGGPPAADDKDAQAEDNYAKWRENEVKEKERKYVNRAWISTVSHCSRCNLQADRRTDRKVSKSLSFPI